MKQEPARLKTIHRGSAQSLFDTVETRDVSQFSRTSIIQRMIFSQFIFVPIVIVHVLS